MKHGILLVTLLEIVVGNPRPEMVHVMESDAARHPLQQGGESEEGASRNGRRAVVPMLVVLPVSTLELVLHEEEPEAGGNGNVVRRQINQKDARADEGRESKAEDHDRGVGGPNTHDLPPPCARSARRYPLLQNKENRSEHEVENRMSEDAISESPPPRTCEILAHGQRVDVAVTAAIEVTRRRMVQSVLVSPVLKRNERQQTCNGTDDLIGPPRWEE